MRHFSGKKLVGAVSWHLGRKARHLPEIAAALRTDILTENVDHIAFTGDLVNISGWQEFDAGLRWLKELGKPDFVSYTPGNHDAYVDVPWQNGLGKFADYMTSDNPRDQNFPFLRLRRNIALLGIHAACPQNILSAGGTVGQNQLHKLAIHLDDLKQRGFYRVVMIHHPAAPGIAHMARALSDVEELASVLKKHGAELVIHGHNHEQSLNYIETEQGQIPVIGVPAASMKPSAHHEAAAWNRYDIVRVNGGWQTRTVIRQWNDKLQSFAEIDNFMLTTTT
jgi:3',5'-cyclic AMP phosphodiesterase CpdA